VKEDLRALKERIETELRDIAIRAETLSKRSESWI